MWLAVSSTKRRLHAWSRRYSAGQRRDDRQFRQEEQAEWPPEQVRQDQRLAHRGLALVSLPAGHLGGIDLQAPCDDPRGRARSARVPTPGGAVSVGSNGGHDELSVLSAFAIVRRRKRGAGDSREAHLDRLSRRALPP